VTFVGFATSDGNDEAAVAVVKIMSNGANRKTMAVEILGRCVVKCHGVKIRTHGEE
jgi:hypothetical protein